MQQTHEVKQNVPLTTALDPAVEVGTVTFKVADLQRSLTFYTGLIGLQSFSHGEHTAVLGAGSRPILLLEEVSGARPQPANTTGLYHAAILLPDRHALAIKIAQIGQRHYPFGYGDHLVSEAFYLSDPDGNGLELYRDRPRSEWLWDGQQVRMATDPIDFDNFFAEVKPGDPALANPAVPAGTKLGHMHLRIPDISESEHFYHGVLGFDITARLPGALFLSAGGYHHHIGMNTWESRGGRPPVEPSAGLREFSIVLPTQAELERLTRQVEAAGISVEHGQDSTALLDPFQNHIRLILKEQLRK